MERVVILLLLLCLAVGVLILLTVIIHFTQWRRTSRTGGSPESSHIASRAIFEAALKPLSSIEKKYLHLFLEGKSTEEISSAMHVEPSSVYTMKYRIRKKFPADYSLPF